MFKIKYTGAERISVIVLVASVALALYTFIRFHIFVGVSFSYLPISQLYVDIISNFIADFMLLYILVLTFIKIRKQKKSEITVVERYIEFTFNEPVSILLYNLDKGYLRLKQYVEEKLN